MVRAFYEADKLKRQRVDEEAWLQGLYVCRALEATVGNMFRKSGAKPSKYPSEPFGLEEEKKPQNEEAEELFAQAYMMNMVMAGKNWKK